jgi:ring-1,2-phenylacetyl-CoA epoxidase subunit PaaC
MTDYLLHLADNALVLGHRNSEWTGHGPILEQDIALSNISLDLIGQARNFYQYASEKIGNGSTEDSLAYLRGDKEYKNCLIVEQPNGHWGTTILRQFLFSAYQQPLYEQHLQINDKQLSAIAAKSLKEVTYHLRWSSEWVIRLGQGTDESHAKMIEAIDSLWKFTDDMLVPAPYDPFIKTSRVVTERWHIKVKEIFRLAGLTVPPAVNMIVGGKVGKHTAHLSEMLEEMQYLQRTYPRVEW